MTVGHYCLGSRKQTLRLWSMEKARPEASNRFRNSDAVNEALRSLIRTEDARQGLTKRSPRTRRTAARR